MKIGEIGEFGLITKIAAKLPPLSINVKKGIGDDTAVLENEDGNYLLMTTDMLVENIHFSLKYGTYHSAGWKALAVNVSDIAAMGGTPTYAVVALAVPPGAEVSEIEELYAGIGECAREYGVDVVGGDTVKSAGGLTINITLLGSVKADRVIYRSGAAPGDIIMVTGSLGHSAAGLHALSKGTAGAAGQSAGGVLHSHLYPSARLREGQALGRSGMAASMNDISDGLASEILEICEASGTGCELFSGEIPISASVAGIAGHAAVDPVEWALYGGEDFELVFTVRPQNIGQVKDILDETGCSPVVVGTILPVTEGCSLVKDGKRHALRPGGYDHFRD
ncbi:MAG TPA: thiamine-phosphate kinase [Verrucomicrobiae bacterium]|nr:thiamine-phosphate kinase [Verrucomicrobiae bacterium]